MKNKRILITGATGLLGTRLSRYLIGRDWPVITHSRSSQSDVRCDLRQKQETHLLLDEIMPDFIVNLAALTNVDKCEEDYDLAFQQNVRTVEILTDWIQGHPSCRLVHISTDQVYGGSGPHKEHDVVMLNLYAITKYCSEVVASKVGATILRTNFFGKSLVKNRMSLSDWVIDSLQRRAEISLFSDIYFTPLSMNTLSAMLEKVLECPVAGVYNLGSRTGMSKSDFALHIAQVFGLPSVTARITDSTSVKLKAPRPKDMRMDSGFFERVFSVRLPSLSDEILSLRNEYEIST